MVFPQNRLIFKQINFHLLFEVEDEAVKLCNYFPQFSQILRPDEMQLF